MKKIIIMFALGLLTQQTTHAQGTMTYLSNLDQTSAGSLAVGSDSWLAVDFYAGTNASGYVLNSIQLGMANASGNPSGFTVMLYSSIVGGAVRPGSSLGTLDGSLNPTTAGIYTFTPASNLTLSPGTGYFIVLTAGTTVANGAYEWSYASANFYNPSGYWDSQGGVLTSSNGSSWLQFIAVPSQFAINATPIPEPDILGLLGLGASAFLCHRRKVR